MDRSKSLFLRALRRQPVERTPVWLMRQAGRYLPEYRKVRAQAGDFMSLCRTPELACEVTLQPLARFPLDAAIIFSDILTIPDAMGLGLHFVEGEGPRFRQPIASPDDIARLGTPDPAQDLRYVIDAVRITRAALPAGVPLIGFAGSPWTLATYMVEGGATADFSRIKRLMFDHPEALQKLLEVLGQSVALLLEAQLRAGADAVMIFDTWGGVLAPADFQRYSLAPMQRIVETVKSAMPAPIILFTKGAGQHLPALADTGASALGVDWTTDLGDARRRVGEIVALQGNLDPCALFARPERVRAEVERVLASFGAGPGHVFNLGHGVLPETPPEHVAAMVAAVHELSPAYHRPR